MTTSFRRPSRVLAAAVVAAGLLGPLGLAAAPRGAFAADGLRGPKLEDLAPGPEALGIRPYGWVAVAATTSPGHDAATRTGRVFDDDAAGVRLHQVYLALERALDDDGTPGIGGKVAVVGGTDARRLRAAGRLDDQEGDVLGDVLDAWTHLASFAWTSPVGGDPVFVNAVVGPEAPDDDRRLRAVLDATWALDLSERWQVAVHGDLGLEEDAGRDGRDARWGGAALYLTHTLSERLAATLRAEVFHDRDGTRLGAPATVGALTLGADGRPEPAVPDLRLRPEVRWDHGFTGRPSGGGSARDAFSLTFEVLFEF